MKNKEDGHGRPCFYSFQDEETGLYWFIPISSKVDKYFAIYNKIAAKHKKCDTLAFSFVLGKQRVFLIQNMCPVSIRYISDEYIDSSTGSPVKIDYFDSENIISKARATLYSVRNGNKKLVFPDILYIESQLLL